ncbi:hypothetical protein FO675_07180 [Riemerella anatipestifer]|uniref:hypothetical protein n=1 Tax=Riemerella anatipestifer TaxID=34085 RepID=UPI001AD62541|nr:hypothetical protein [Riemerella anatipestifer]MBO4234084.1 hypothetical protein [Riemerella anatipestifer]MDD1539409.1 hypothetical protein [Riemerella anatipestifer]MDY3344398.1 hypothetical protein [Riemerella anatipestifer]MDY3357478.1 hypothetical protein [Riemerella anatipestifer]QYR02329.1 hypothetical protein J6M00_09070 [Riemerella anatipestifer]
MTKAEFLQIIKKHFTKFGLSESTLGEITKLIEGSYTENSTAEEIIEQCKSYESLAKVLQSEIDTRVNSAVEKVKKEQAPDKKSGADKEAEPTIGEYLKQISERLDNIEKGQVVKSLNEKAVARLKELKMTDKEIEAAMFERNFENEESLNAFVTKQTEIYEEIVKERVSNSAGNGFSPMSSSGNGVENTAIKNDIEEFNKQF